jgi:hypothetical protein
MGKLFRVLALIIFMSGCATYGEPGLQNFNSVYNQNIPASPLFKVTEINLGEFDIAIHQGGILISPGYVRFGHLRKAGLVVAKDTCNNLNQILDTSNFQQEGASGWVHATGTFSCKNATTKSVESVPKNINERDISFPRNSHKVGHLKVTEQPDDIAVIIGNADYSDGKDIPNVTPAYADAEGIKHYVTQALGIKEENIIFIKDANQGKLISTFGSATNPKGQLYNYVKPGKSKVFVYYSGHGAPGGEDGSSYIVPTDAQASMIDLNGYPLSTLYKNLGQIPAKSVTVVLEACFSGASQSGSVITQASPIYLKAKETSIPSGITVIAAGAANQIASWEQDSSSGLFTKYFLMGMSGEADAAPYGNGDGKIGYDELGSYFKDTLTYYARRYYGRDQTVQIVEGGL